MRSLLLLAAFFLLGIATADPTPDAAMADWESYRAHIAAANAHRRLNEASTARRWLNGTTPKHRGWEHRWLASSLDQSVTTFRDEDTPGSPNGMILSPCNQLMAVWDDAGSSTSLRLLDISTGAVIQTLATHARAIHGVAFTADGRRVATASADTSVVVWDALEGKELTAFRGHDMAVGGVAFVDDDKSLVSCSVRFHRPERRWIGEVRFWDASSGEELALVDEVGAKPLVAMSRRPGGDQVAVASWDFCVFLIDVAGRELALRLDIPRADQENQVHSVAYSPDGKWVVAGAEDGTVAVWDVATGELVREIRDHTARVGVLAFDPSGTWLATGADDAVIWLYRVGADEPGVRLYGHDRALRSLAWTDDGNALWSQSLDGSRRSWSPPSGSPGNYTFLADRGIGAVEFSPDGSKLLTALFDGHLIVWNAMTGERQHSWMGMEGGRGVNTAAWNPAGDRVLTCSWNGVANVWSLQPHILHHELRHAGGLTDIAWHRDGQRLASSMLENTVALWDMAADEPTSSSLVGFRGRPEQLAFSPVNEYLAVSCGGGASWWKLDNDEFFQSVKSTYGAGVGLAFSPDGATIYLGTANGQLVAADAATAAVKWASTLGDHTVQTLAVWPDGERLIAGMGPNALIVDTLTGDVVLTMDRQPESVYSVDVSPDGHQAAAASLDGTVCVWDDRGAGVN